MLAAKAELKHAQPVKEYLLKRDLLHSDYLLVKEMGFIFYPLVPKAQNVKIPKAEVINAKFNFPAKPKSLTARDILSKSLTPHELSVLPTSQEMVGNILILEIPPELESKERVIAEAYLRVNRNISTVVKKGEIHTGEYRMRKVKVLTGKNTKETIHHENGIELKLHLEQTYFSARSAHERLRLAKLIKKREEVLVMFSGAAPYPLVIAKNSPAKHVWGIELNPLAHNLAEQNLELNRMREKITILLGDVRDIVPKLKKKFDRIIMPLPKTGEEFLPFALSTVKKGGMIHLYAFWAEDEIPAEKRKIRELCRQQKHIVRIVRDVLCGQFSPRVFRVCFDIKVLK